ncbi:DUF6282 family protein [Alterinioella nitratireducens]|uniref:DUF6282 family protein n=1 Tax=Alterinioella nitratireducens TaxID=2735915 RepID=UPI001557EBEF|nr:DUF6282 family protein [Alterinioella nitratireducens]NPD18805.1 hypothetical protein [Alterinioella nitratireducens]
MTPPETALPPGTLDLHVHAAPDIKPRSVNDLSLARACVDLGWQGAALKSHSEPTGGRAAMAGAATGAGMIGGLVLNRAIGGLNPRAIAAFASATPDTARIVWMPTRDAAHDIARKGTGRAAVPVLDGSAPAEGLTEVLEAIARHDLVLASGHLHPAETVAVFRLAKAAGVRRLLVTHATAPITDMGDDLLQECLELGAHVEICARNVFGDDRARIDPAKLGRAAEVFRLCGGRALLSSDLGDTRYPLPWEGLAQLAGALAGQGIPAADLRHALTEIPAHLVHQSTA